MSIQCNSWSARRDSSWSYLPHSSMSVTPVRPVKRALNVRHLLRGTAFYVDNRLQSHASTRHSFRFTVVDCDGTIHYSRSAVNI